MTDAATRLTQNFHELAKCLHSCPDPEGMWQQLADLAAGSVTGCDSASVVKAPRAHRPASVLAASAEVAREFDHVQCAAGEGPSIDAAAIGGMVTSADLTTELRWPGLKQEGSHSVRTAACFRIADEPCGLALNFYGTASDAFDSAALGDAALVAAHAGTFALYQDSVRKVVNLEQALETSRTIGAAIGIVMLARKITPDQAFDVLRNASQRMHVKIRELAQLVTETGELPQIAPVAPRRPSVPAPAATPVSVG